MKTNQKFNYDLETVKEVSERLNKKNDGFKTSVVECVPGENLGCYMLRVETTEKELKKSGWLSSENLKNSIENIYHVACVVIVED